eukprot:1093562-Amphidinium_carterae.1
MTFMMKSICPNVPSARLCHHSCTKAVADCHRQVRDGDHLPFSLSQFAYSEAAVTFQWFFSWTHGMAGGRLRCHLAALALHKWLCTKLGPVPMLRPMRSRSPKVCSSSTSSLWSALNSGSQLVGARTWVTCVANDHNINVGHLLLSQILQVECGTENWTPDRKDKSTKLVSFVL